MSQPAPSLSATHSQTAGIVVSMLRPAVRQIDPATEQRREAGKARSAAFRERRRQSLTRLVGWIDDDLLYRIMARGHVTDAEADDPKQREKALGRVAVDLLRREFKDEDF